MSTAEAAFRRVAAQEEVYEGTVLRIERGAVTLLVEGDVKELRLAPRTVLWRGSPVDATAIEVGDRLLVRLDEESLVERAWANLTRQLGTVKEVQHPYLRVRRAWLSISRSRHLPAFLIPPRSGASSRP